VPRMCLDDGSRTAASASAWQFAVRCAEAEGSAGSWRLLRGRGKGHAKLHHSLTRSLTPSPLSDAPLSFPCTQEEQQRKREEEEM